MLHQTQLESNHWLALEPGFRIFIILIRERINTEPKWKYNSMHNDKNTHRFNWITWNAVFAYCLAVCCAYDFLHGSRNITKLHIALCWFASCAGVVPLGKKTGFSCATEDLFFKPVKPVKKNYLNISIIWREKICTLKFSLQKLEMRLCWLSVFVLVETAAA